ncbi:MAG TPA: DUF1501 domain-containing protein [Bryobacteraceae bacterium]|nr:DUF1501 domain-containing protein [Bryobacteraceae bacterium]
MNLQDRFNRFVTRYPHSHLPFFQRPHASRREFFQLLGAGVTGSMLLRPRAWAADIRSTPVSMQSKARNVIFILLTGAPSHTDTFDFKQSTDTPASFKPETINGLAWPTGLLPKMAEQLPNMAIVRSVRAWALVHSLSQSWVQIGRNPAAALGNIAPNIGSVVAIEKDGERGSDQVFPTFLALNATNQAGPGYLPARYAPFKLTPNVNNPGLGLPNTTNAAGASRMQDRWSMLHGLDDSLRVNSPLGAPVSDYEDFYQAAKGLMYNSVVDKAFKFTAEDAASYGRTPFGASCLVAKQVLAANQGTRYVQITYGSWDMHQNIYSTAANAMPAMGKILDDGVSALLADLKASGQLDETLVVMMGEFGRTVGRITAAGGRDHYPQQSVIFAGAGVRGGRAIGSTDATGANTKDYGWSRGRDIKPEDVEATIYSAMGINWTSVRYDDPFKRGFEYVPFSDQDLYGPINELWS